MKSHTNSKVLYALVAIWINIGVECYWSNYSFYVRNGGSVSLPCPYGPEHKLKKKFWFSDIDQSRTYTNTTEGNVLVIDRPDQNLFTVTMRNLQQNQSGKYECSIQGVNPVNILKYYFNVQEVPEVWLRNSSVSAVEGGNISVQCFYRSDQKQKQKQWCRMKDQNEDQKCYEVEKMNKSQNASVQISDDEVESFTVLMTGLMETDSGWFFCSVGEKQALLLLTVTKAKPGADSEKHLNKSLHVWLPTLAALLIIAIVVAVFIWKLGKKNKHKEETRTGNNSEISNSIYCKAEDPAVYYTIDDENLSAISTRNPIYSTGNVPPESVAER